MSRKPLTPRLRKRWDALIASDGALIGLSDCHVLLENKLVNDVFYRGTFKGLPCIVKCSSRAPESILNEYELGRRLHQADPVHFPAVYACHAGPMAFVVSEFIEGGRSLADDPSDRYADEVLAILDTLYKSDVVHRDIFAPNFLIASDGHLKLIDCQFAVDMRTKKIDPWLEAHPKYHFATFAAFITREFAFWDDAAFAQKLLPSLLTRAEPLIGRLRFELRFKASVRIRLCLLTVSLHLQRLFHRRGSCKWSAIVRRLERFK